MNELDLRELARLIADELRADICQAVMTTKGTAAYCSVGEQHLERLRSVGGGPRFVKLDRLVRYRRADLDDWLAVRVRSNTAGGATP